MTAVALDPPPEPGPPVPQVPPPTWFFVPTTTAWLPQAFTGMLIGAWIVLPDRMPRV